MDIERALRNMDEDSRKLVKNCVEAYKKTGNQKYAEEAIAILNNFIDEDDVKAYIKSLKR